MAEASKSPASNRRMPPKPQKKRINCWVNLDCYARLNQLAEVAGGFGLALEDMCRREAAWAERGDMAARVLKSGLPEHDKIEAVKPIIGAQ